MRDLVYIVLISGIGILAFRRPDWGVYAFVGLGILNLQSYMWAMGKTFPFALIVALCTIAGFFFSKSKWTIPRQREVWILLVLWLLFGLSTLVAAVPDRGAPSATAVDRFILVSKILLMVSFTFIILQTIDEVQWLMKVIALSIGFYAIKGGVFSVTTGFSNIFWGPESSFLYANNAIGLAIAMNVPFLFYLIKIESNIWIRRLMWSMLFCSYPAVLGTFSRGAWLGLAGATAMLVLRSKHKVWLIPVGGMAFLLFLPILSTDLVPERLANRFNQLINYEDEASAQSRFWSWEACLRVGIANPEFGEGFNFYSPDVYVKYFPEFIEKYGSQKSWSCHSMWFTVFAEHGFPTFLIWITLLGFTFSSLRKISKYSKKRIQLNQFRYMASMLKMGLVVYMICGTFLDTAYFDLYYQLVGTVVILKESSKNISKASFGEKSYSPFFEAKVQQPTLT